ncbi:unnamed protein product [Ambrosiozyma monospora]|uniref:Unnamed protein product n=1 Tax=Ambrosiozyma monospora TaxID=43982 RepID=A0ACB5SWM7_AMBMO|nr:unnamed protein product [Ambrosiozyma monospora]
MEQSQRMSETNERSSSTDDKPEQKQHPEKPEDEQLGTIRSRIIDAAIAEANAIANDKFNTVNHYYRISSDLVGLPIDSPFDLNFEKQLTNYQNLRTEDARTRKFIDISNSASTIFNRFDEVRGIMGSVHLCHKITEKKKKDPNLHYRTGLNRYMVHFSLALPILQFLAVPSDDIQSVTKDLSTKEIVEKTSKIGKTYEKRRNRKRRKIAKSNATGSSILKENYEDFLKSLDYSLIDKSIDNCPANVVTPFLLPSTDETVCESNFGHALLLELKICAIGTECEKQFTIKDDLGGVLPEYITAEVETEEEKSINLNEDDDDDDDDDDEDSENRKIYSVTIDFAMTKGVNSTPGVHIPLGVPNANHG